jgi:hypothetical protein
MNILVAGDSFAAEWPGSKGWPKLLKQNFNITNVAQAGVSEYKILKQLKSVDLDSFDIVIVSHTSPYRVHTKKHPIHKKGLHENCDLIYNDIVDRVSFFNPRLKSAQSWFNYHFDEEYQEEIYVLIRKEIRNFLSTRKYISITHTDISTEYSVEHNNISFSDIWSQNKGKENHYNEIGNLLVHKKLFDIIEK